MGRIPGRYGSGTMRIVVGISGHAIAAPIILRTIIFHDDGTLTSEIIQFFVILMFVNIFLNK